MQAIPGMPTAAGLATTAELAIAERMPTATGLAIAEGMATVAGLANEVQEDGLFHGQMAVVEANIDDMNPEIYSAAMEKLFAAGAVDVYMVPMIMKKARPANVLTVLTPLAALDKVVETVFRETTSIGLRISYVEKRFLPRKMVELMTPWGPVKAKACYLKDELINLAPEYEDCRRLSAETGVPVKQIYQAAKKE